MDDPICFRSTVVMSAVSVFLPWALLDGYQWYVAIRSKRLDPQTCTLRALTTMAWILSLVTLISLYRSLSRTKENTTKNVTQLLNEFETEVGHFLPILVITIVITVSLLARQWPITQNRPWAAPLFSVPALLLLTLLIQECGSITKALTDRIQLSV